jgi:hypothetical protein
MRLYFICYVLSLYLIFLIYILDHVECVMYCLNVLFHIKHITFTLHIIHYTLHCTHYTLHITHYILHRTIVHVTSPSYDMRFIIYQVCAFFIICFYLFIIC